MWVCTITAYCILQFIKLVAQAIGVHTEQLIKIYVSVGILVSHIIVTYCKFIFRIFRIFFSHGGPRIYKDIPTRVPAYLFFLLCQTNSMKYSYVVPYFCFCIILEISLLLSKNYPGFRCARVMDI